MACERIYSPVVKLFKPIFLRKPMETVLSEDVRDGQRLNESVTSPQMIGLAIGGIIGE